MDAVDAELATVGAVLVEDRLLRRVIKRHRGLPGIGLQVPHAACYTLPRADLVKQLALSQVRIDPSALPERVIAFRGSREALAAGDRGELTRAWRAIFHGKIHQAFDDLLAAGTITAGAIRERVNRIGQTEFDEIRFVLRQEDLLLPPVDEVETYIEFVALYLELAYFSPTAIERTFPTLRDSTRVTATIALDLDADALLAASRPPGAHERTIADAGPLLETVRPELVPDPSVREAAAIARAKGNRARAALLALRAGDDAIARGDLDELVRRLAAALHTTPELWTEALTPVAQFAASQRVIRFTAGARLLYDLQAACVVAEREVRVVDVANWALSLGKRPIVRALPATREVRIAKHLHAAAKKIAKVSIGSVDQREQLSAAIHAMVERADHNVRTALRPKIEAALDEVQLHPRHLPERVGEKKLVDELLDQAVAVGRLSIGDLRDALSHNDLKLPDLSATALAKEDQLLHCDRLLATSLDGVYRRGEIYLRFLQKLSSVMFGTPIGRWVSRYALGPLIGAYVVLVGLQHLAGPAFEYAIGVHPAIYTRYSLAGGTAFLFLLLHVGAFRRGVIAVLRAIGHASFAVFVAAPRAVWRLPIMRQFRRSGVNRWVVKPAIPAALAATFLRGRVQWPVAVGVFVFIELVANSRRGRLAEEAVSDGVVRSSRHLARFVLPGMLKYTLDFFIAAVELTERGIYRVDEWLRFKVGQSRATLVAKGTLGTLWFLITYFLRIYINLFVEPVINPVKHIPTVTVAAKVMVPFDLPMLKALRGPLRGVLGPALGNSLAAFTVFVIPGLAGFLVWELKANWRLYEATRPDTLRAVSIGHHGETMVTFLKPGFHSGTIPTLSRKLRRAAWKADERGVARHREGLHHVEEAIHKFVHRSLVSMLNESRSFRATDVAVDDVELASNRVQIELRCHSVGPDPAVITFEQQSGWLVASVPTHGWIDQLDATQRGILEIALAGFYKLSGVDIVREQLEAAINRAPGPGPSEAPPYDISDEGIVVWPGRGYQTEVVYDLHARSLVPTVRGAPFDGEPTAIAAREALYGRDALRWATWAVAWQLLAAGGEPMRIVVGPSLLARRNQPDPEA